MVSKKEQARLAAAKRRLDRLWRREQAALEKDQSISDAAQRRRHAQEVKTAKRGQGGWKRLASHFETEIVRRMARICKVALPPDKPVSFDTFNLVSGLPVMLGCAHFGVARLEDVLGFCHRPIDFAGSSICRILTRLEGRYPGQKAALIARLNGSSEDMVLTNWEIASGGLRRDDSWMRCLVKNRPYILNTLPSFIARLKREKMIRR